MFQESSLIFINSQKTCSFLSEQLLFQLISHRAGPKIGSFQVSCGQRYFRTIFALKSAFPLLLRHIETLYYNKRTYSKSIKRLANSKYTPTRSVQHFLGEPKKEPLFDCVLMVLSEKQNSSRVLLNLLTYSIGINLDSWSCKSPTHPSLTSSFQTVQTPKPEKTCSTSRSRPSTLPLSLPPFLPSFYILTSFQETILSITQRILIHPLSRFTDVHVLLPPPCLQFFHGSDSLFPTLSLSPSHHFESQVERSYPFTCKYFIRYFLSTITFSRTSYQNQKLILMQNTSLIHSSCSSFVKCPMKCFITAICLVQDQVLQLVVKSTQSPLLGKNSSDFFFFPNLDLIEESWPTILQRIPPFGSFWYILIIAFRLRILGRNTMTFFFLGAPYWKARLCL